MNLSLSTWRRRRILPQNILRSSLLDKSRSSMTTAILFMVRGFVQIPLKFDLTPIIIFFPPLESRAIGRYIALKYANQGTQGLIPDGSDFEATGRFEEACSLEYSQFNPSAEGLGQELIFKKYGLLNFLLQAIKIHYVLQLGSGVEKQIPLPSRNTLPHLRRNWMPTRKS